MSNVSEQENTAEDELYRAHEEYGESIRQWDRVNNSFKRGEADRAELAKAWDQRQAAFKRLRQLEGEASARAKTVLGIEE